MSIRFFSFLAVATVVAAVPFTACVEPPPKIAAMPASGLSLRLYTFGASAKEAREAFELVKANNKSFALVREGGDGEVLVGLENDSPKCVQPTALCSFKVAYRIKDNQGKVVHASTTTISANAERCTGLCERALNNIAVRVVEAAAAALKGNEIPVDEASVDDGGGAVVVVEASAAVDAAPAKPKKHGGKEVKPEPPMCSVAAGPHLPTQEAETRAAQVEALKRLGVLEQDEYDCLRKKYLERL
jgi:hypothetical protein